MIHLDGSDRKIYWKCACALENLLCERLMNTWAILNGGVVEYFQMIQDVIRGLRLHPIVL